MPTDEPDRKARDDLAQALHDEMQREFPKFTHRKLDDLDEATGVFDRYRRLADRAIAAAGAVAHRDGAETMRAKIAAWMREPESLRTAEAMALWEKLATAVERIPPPPPAERRPMPDGWKLVPIEPTDDMAGIGGKEVVRLTDEEDFTSAVDAACCAYRDMVAAAPLPLPAEGEG
jgi:hypothetical protein